LRACRLCFLLFRSIGLIPRLLRPLEHPYRMPPYRSVMALVFSSPFLFAGFPARYGICLHVRARDPHPRVLRLFSQDHALFFFLVHRSPARSARWRFLGFFFFPLFPFFFPPRPTLDREHSLRLSSAIVFLLTPMVISRSSFYSLSKSFLPSSLGLSLVLGAPRMGL